MKMSKNSKMASRFLFAAYIVRLLDVMASRFLLAASQPTLIRTFHFHFRTFHWFISAA